MEQKHIPAPSTIAAAMVPATVPDAEQTKPATLPVLHAGGFSASVDAFAWEPDPAARRMQIWFLSLLGPKEAVKALWARLIKGEVATISFEQFGKARFCALAPEGPRAWRFFTASLRSAAGYHGVLVPEAAFLPASALTSCSCHANSMRQHSCTIGSSTGGWICRCIRAGPPGSGSGDSKPARPSPWSPMDCMPTGAAQTPLRSLTIFEPRCVRERSASTMRIPRTRCHGNWLPVASSFVSMLRIGDGRRSGEDTANLRRLRHPLNNEGLIVDARRLASHGLAKRLLPGIDHCADRGPGTDGDRRFRLEGGLTR